jgi:Fe-S-cluster containining protein
MTEFSSCRDPWWKQDPGVRFSCTGCGRCCSGEPGAVWLSPGDLAALAEVLGESEEVVVRRYCRVLDGKLALREVKRIELGAAAIQHDCIFLEGGKLCRIYEGRPTQCRTFPFWPEVMESRESWEALRARGCEGVDLGDEPIAAEKIAGQLAMMRSIPGFDAARD